MRIKGFLVVDGIIDAFKPRTYNLIPFEMNGKKYIYKIINGLDIYNELIGEEIAKDFGIPCASYDLAIYYKTSGVVTENFLGDKERLVYGFDLIEKNVPRHKLYPSTDYNYLEFYKNYINKELFEYLKQVFIYDVISANPDRHDSNIAFIKDENGILKPAPIFDNEKILHITSIRLGRYMLGVTKEDCYYMSLFNSELAHTQRKSLVKRFIEYYDEKDTFYKKIDVLSDKNIDSIISRVEDKIEYEMKPKIKKLTISKMKENRDRLIEELDSIK